MFGLVLVGGEGMLETSVGSKGRQRGGGKKAAAKTTSKKVALRPFTRHAAGLTIDL